MTTARPPMLLTYKYRLNPEKRQHRALDRILEQQRQLYNAALEERIECYRKTGRSISDVDQSRSLTLIRADDPAFADVQRRIQRATLKRLERAYKMFFKRAKAGAGAASGFPNFKGREHFDGFAFDAFQQITLRDGGLRFSGMPGKLRVHFDRPLPLIADPETGELKTSIKNIWFKREGRMWYCGFQVEVSPRASRDGLGKGVIGADWGTSVLAALSSGEMIPNPRHGEALQKDLARAQRAVVRKKRGSRGRGKARRHLQAVQRRIANRRRNTMDKVSARLAKQYALVAVEKIEAKGLMNAERAGQHLPQFIKTRRNREALDAAPYMLRQMLAYKARREGTEVIEIDPAEKLADGTRAQPTQRCSMCGKLHFKELTDAHICTSPGPFQNIRLPRKTNAARVILSLALDGYGATAPSGRLPSGEPGRTEQNDRGGPVPGGVSSETNADTGPRRPGNTADAQAGAGRRGQSPLLTHVRGARDPRLRRSSGW
jgi:putative transposase